ncbi:hypothetical protein CBR_g31926 [Chara braunii]|uniref:Uncharacterized protein n=1 Tax=Chara braunii TaxID=69332 RepID=A0A388LG16_CHABU|nr:hypothetical protein CBR_g31926 [Chara braunii]|eukprot:GBG81254.1 hypothetical protein CBR_g31926 [Chara braunii]
MFDFQLERISGNKNKADGLSRIEWEKPGDAKEETPPVDGFLDEDDMQLHVNSWRLSVNDREARRGKSMWYAPATFVKIEELVLKPFIEEDPWGERNGEWMKELAWAETYRLTDDPVTIEAGTKQVDHRLLTMGRVHYLVNALLQVQAENEGEIVKADEIVLGDDLEFDEEMKGDEFEQGGISEDFREEEYDGFHLEMLIRLHEMLREDCEWLLEGEAEVADKLGRMEEGRRREMKIPIQELQDRIREKTELLTWGLANYVPEILKEIQRLRAREERKDMQWTKVEKEMKGLKAETKKTKIEQGKLKVKVEALNIALDNKSEVETKKMEKERLEREIGETSLTGNRVRQDRKRSYLETLIGAASQDIPSSAKRTKEEEKKLCWYCMKGVNRRDDCPGFKTERAKGLLSLDENIRLIDRKGNLSKRTKEGFRV